MKNSACPWPGERSSKNTSSANYTAPVAAVATPPACHTTASPTRLEGDILDFSRFCPGQEVAAFAGSGWTPAEVRHVGVDHLLVTGRRLASRTLTDFRVYDSRNVSDDPKVVAAARAAAKEQARFNKAAAQVGQEELEVGV